MSAHTPGPWAWGGEPGGSELSAAGGKKVFDYAGYEGLWPAAYHDGTDTANLRLIAAAPELLEALQLVDGCLNGGFDVAPGSAAHEAIRAAIKKATEA